MSTDEGTVAVEREDRATIVTLRRGQRLNAMNQTMWEALERVVGDLARDPARSVILTGEGGAFCAGYDIRPDNPMTARLSEAIVNRNAEPVRALIVRLKRILSSIAELPMPTIAAINGRAVGGGVEMALCCDLRVIDADATLCMSETRIGVIPDLGGTVRLLRLLGRSRGLDLICTAREVGAEEALSLGLVDRIAPAGRSVEHALSLARLIAANGPVAVRAVKRVAARIDGLAADLEIETEAAVQTLLAGEAIEGITAWLQKRPAEFNDPPP